MTETPNEELLDSKQLASVLKRSVKYVYAMRACGFKMIGGRTTLTAAMEWLKRHPHPRGGEVKRISPQGRAAS